MTMPIRAYQGTHACQDEDDPEEDDREHEPDHHGDRVHRRAARGLCADRAHEDASSAVDVRAVVLAGVDLDPAADHEEDQDEHEPDDDRAPAGADILEEDGAPEFEEDDQAEADARCRAAEPGREPAVVKRVALTGLGVPDDVARGRDRHARAELLVLVLPLLAVERVARRRAGRSERDTPDESEERERERVTEDRVHQVADRDRCEDRHEGVGHRDREHRLENVDVDRLAELGQTCCTSEVTGRRVDSLHERRDRRAEDQREDRIDVLDQEDPRKAGAERTPETVGRGFPSHRLVEDAVDETHLRSELDLRVRVALRPDIGLRVLRSTGDGGERTCQCSDSDSEYDVFYH